MRRPGRRAKRPIAVAATCWAAPRPAARPGDPRTVRQVNGDWRQRSYIEYGDRFDPEEDLDVDAMRVETLERMRRLFILVLLAAQFIRALGVGEPDSGMSFRPRAARSRPAPARLTPTLVHVTQRYTATEHFYGDIYAVEQKQEETRVIVKIEPIKASLDAIFR